MIVADSLASVDDSDMTAIRCRPAVTRPRSQQGGCGPMVVNTRAADQRLRDMADVRELFPGAERQVYLDSAGVSLPSVRSVELIKQFADTALLDPRSAHHADAPTRVRESAAQLIGARPEQ